MTSQTLDYSKVLDLFQGVITEEDNLTLVSLSSSEEIESVVKSLSSWKALGMDGFNGEFYKSSLRIVSSDVINVIHLFFHGNSNLEAINLALLIPNPNCSRSNRISTH